MRYDMQWVLLSWEYKLSVLLDGIHWPAATCFSSIFFGCSAFVLALNEIELFGDDGDEEDEDEIIFKATDWLTHSTASVPWVSTFDMIFKKVRRF